MMDGLDSLRAENDALRKRIEGMDAIIQEVRTKRNEAEKNCEILAAEIESLRQERNAARAELAQMKSTLSDTQQTLRAVQEDRDEFAAKMNDAVERAEQLEAELSDTRRQYELSRIERDRMEEYRHFERGLINALQFALLCVTGNTERVNGIDWLWNEDSLNFKGDV